MVSDSWLRKAQAGEGNYLFIQLQERVGKPRHEMLSFSTNSTVTC